MRTQVYFFILMTLFCVAAILVNGCSILRKNKTVIAAIEKQMVFVEGGTFTMGSPAGVGENDERPQHQVILSNYSIGKYPVTQAQWIAVMGTNVRQQRDMTNPTLSLAGEGGNYPMYYVSWNDIVGTSGVSIFINGIRYYENGFIYKLNQLTGKNYRLPTEAEWEYAARGGNRSREHTYSNSNTVGNVAWYRENSGGSTQPVGTKASNELGIYDMLGNVWEWCSDWYGSYTSDAKTNPWGPVLGPDRVLRGGSWGNDAGFCRVTSRGLINPAPRNNYVGFRLVLH